jgi:predicted double-glycine peptidase
MALDGTVMNPWLETVTVAALVCASAYLGLRLARLSKPVLATGLVAAFSLILIIALGRRFVSLSFTPPISWIMEGRTEYAVTGAAIAALLTALVVRLPSRRQRVLVAAFACVAVANMSVLPFALPGLTQRFLLSLDNQIDSDGVCLQNTSYTCGPASAVTALHALGIEGREGELAVLSRTTRLTGTDADLLCAALQSRYRDRGLSCEYRHFDSIAQLDRGAVMLALVKYSFLMDHYVAVLGVADGQVTIGDPLEGKRSMTVAEFETMWRYAGVVLKRNGDSRQGR